MSIVGAGRGWGGWFAQGAVVCAGVVLGAGLTVSVAGCPGNGILCDPKDYPGGLNDPDFIFTCGDLFFDAGPDACASSDASADAPSDAPADGPIPGTCPGQCVPGPPLTWAPPALVWIGPAAEAPPCPPIVSQPAFTGYADLVAPSICGGCRCGQPAGSCSLPATLTAHAATCAAATAGTSVTAFDPPGAWDGSCTTHESIPPGASCPEGPCVQSLVMPPLGLAESGCAPLQLPGPVDTAPSWNTVARACGGFPVGPCDDWTKVCTVPPQGGFRHCLSKEGDVDCPTPDLGPYYERHLFYKDIQDTRSCSPCTCASPTGSACSTLLSFYTDDACSAPLGASTVTSSAPICQDLPAGAGLAAKSASAPLYHPGACLPGGGEPAGSIEPVGPITLCCTPSP